MTLEFGDWVSYNENGGRRRFGLVVDSNDPHNIEVMYPGGGRGVHCIDPRCEWYDPVYKSGFLGKWRRILLHITHRTHKVFRKLKRNQR